VEPVAIEMVPAMKLQKPQVQAGPKLGPASHGRALSQPEARAAQAAQDFGLNGRILLAFDNFASSRSVVYPAFSILL
jgi:hypothetical protein